jgi:hypothetical protein
MNRTESPNSVQGSWSSFLYEGVKKTCLWSTRAITIGGIADYIFCVTADVKKNSPNSLDFYDQFNICSYPKPTSPAFMYKLPVALLSGSNFSEVLDELCKAKSELLYSDILFNDDLLPNLITFIVVLMIVNVYYDVFWGDFIERDEIMLLKAKLLEVIPQDEESDKLNKKKEITSPDSERSSASTVIREFSPSELSDEDFEVAKINELNLRETQELY